MKAITRFLLAIGLFVASAGSIAGDGVELVRVGKDDLSPAVGEEAADLTGCGCRLAGRRWHGETRRGVEPVRAGCWAAMPHARSGRWHQEYKRDATDHRDQGRRRTRF